MMLKIVNSFRETYTKYQHANAVQMGIIGKREKVVFT